MAAGAEIAGADPSLGPLPGFLDWASLPTIATDSARPIALAAGDVHLWLMPLHAVTTWHVREHLLDTGEQDRARRLRFSADRRRFVAAHVALRLILSRYIDQAPGDIRFVLGPQGRPALDPGNGPMPSFNLSHTDEYALIGVAADSQIGVDIELVRSVPEWREIAEAHFTAGELAALLAMPEADRAAAFTLCWTRKEALVKSSGDGLTASLRRFEVAIEGRESPALRSVDGVPELATCWSLTSFEPVPGCLASIASRKCRVRCFKNAPGATFS